MNKHISEQYDIELSQIKELLMEMGGLVEQQVTQACASLIAHDTQLAEQVQDTETRLNQFEVELDDQCVSIIARRQPTAGDLRIVVSVMKAITDLERIGDEADRIAKMALSLARTELPSDRYADFRTMSEKVSRMLTRALDAFARLDIESALRVIQADEEIDTSYNAFVRHSIGAMRDKPDEIENSINVIWAARALERIGDHAKNISEYVIYQVKGLDVRHSGNPDIDD
ncbi:MAG: phosphate signaling complex protein PhoU [Pseudomonadales bacterium]|jgi:phosphate transport system protein|nr:phosphate signaling complex protein PhoU [Pseudomonadales bacterium]